MEEVKEFQTESKELLNLMINSIYSNKEIFLREIISNASDAIDKYKYLSLTNGEKYPTIENEIWIKVNKENRTITVSDNGIGMSKADLIKNLGTIAKSGSKDFMKKVKEAKDVNIIGQFGVGFYSAFMVASKIDVISKTVDGKAHEFISDGKETYTVKDVEKETNGTDIIIYLKEDTEDEKYSEYLEYYMIEELVTKYSDYIRYPIKMEETEVSPKLDKDGKEIENETETKVEVKTLNSMIPLWKKNKSEVEEKDLNEFYKQKFNDYEDPFTSLFIKVDGVISYNALVFIPSHAPYDLYSDSYEKGLDLYSKGIFIKSKCKELIPDYLKFAKGVVDSDDFSLNISREILQNSPILRKIQDNIEKKIVDKLKEIKESDFEKYLKFYKIFGPHLKFGIYSSYGAKKELLQDLLVFHSLKENKYVSLKEYKEKMKENQKYIYYASGKSLDSIMMLPQIEKYKANETDVLLLDDHIDEFALQMIREYEKLEFKNIGEANIEEESQEEKEKLDALLNENKRMIDTIKETLKGKVDEVALSNKLIDSPVCITTKDGLSLSMENTLKEERKAQGINDEEKISATKVLEINPNHDIFKALEKFKDDDEAIKQYSPLLYEEAMLLEGFEIENKREFVKLLNDLMIKALNK